MLSHYLLFVFACDADLHKTHVRGVRVCEILTFIALTA